MMMMMMMMIWDMNSCDLFFIPDTERYRNYHDIYFVISFLYKDTKGTVIYLKFILRSVPYTKAVKMRESTRYIF